MAPHTYSKRIERLQQALAAQIKRPLASRFLPFDPNHTVEDYDRVAEEELDRMVADGEIRANQRARVRFIRWLTAAEHAEKKQPEVDGAVPDTARVDPVPAPTPMRTMVPSVRPITCSVTCRR